MEKTKAFNIENVSIFTRLFQLLLIEGCNLFCNSQIGNFIRKIPRKKFIRSKLSIDLIERGLTFLFCPSYILHKLLFFTRNKIFIKYTGLFLSKLTRILPFLTRILLKFLIRMKSLGEEQIAKYEVRRLHGKISNEIEEWLFRITSFRNPLRVLRVRLTHESICICSHI